MLTFARVDCPARRLDVLDDADRRVATIGQDGWIGLDLRNAVGFSPEDWRAIGDVADQFAAETAGAVRHG